LRRAGIAPATRAPAEETTDATIEAASAEVAIGFVVAGPAIIRPRLATVVTVVVAVVRTTAAVVSVCPAWQPYGPDQRQRCNAEEQKSSQHDSSSSRLERCNQLPGVGGGRASSTSHFRQAASKLY